MVIVDEPFTPGEIGQVHFTIVQLPSLYSWQVLGALVQSTVSEDPVLSRQYTTVQPWELVVVVEHDSGA